MESLVPSTSYLLAYALPLFLVSVVSTFAGAFLTLDRTRSFPPKKPIIWTLEGGIGGLALGYLFGVHVSTFLSLLIPSVTSSAPLGKASFLAVWIISAIATTLLAGRWRYCAFAFAGISAGVLLSISLSIIIHPSLLTRQVITGILTPLSLIASLIPIPRHRQITIRFFSSITGAFGLTLSTALLAHVSPWANAWERLWTSASIEWGTSKEKGLSAMFCLCTALGVVVDWLLKRKFGECPDEKWDAYLADYASNLPDRAGSFQPLTSFWDRLIHPTPSFSRNIPPSLHKHDDDHHTLLSLPQTPAFLGKSRSQARPKRGFHQKKRQGVKFRPMGDFSCDSSDDDTNPWLNQKPSMTSTDTTLIDDHHHNDVIKDLDYDRLQAMGKARDLQMGLIPDHDEASITNSASAVAPLAPVPATPSLIKALDRVAIAQKQAFGGSTTPAAIPLSSPSTSPSTRQGDKTGRWQNFWREVDDKARQ